jgi:TatD DNase family protein
MIEFIDTHSHLYDADFNTDITEVKDRSVSNGVCKVVLPAVDKECHGNLLNLASRFPDFAYPCAGLHPTSVNSTWQQELDFVISEMEAKRPYIAIGEIGMDGYWSKDFMKEQAEVFETQLRLASKMSLPVIIHSRNATEEIFDLLESCRGLNLSGVFHAYSGSYETFQRIQKYGNFMIGIGGVLTFKNSTLVSVVKKTGLSKIILETDAPWLSPVPYRGKRNEPAYIPIIAQRLAEICETTIENVAATTTQNAKGLFKF